MFLKGVEALLLSTESNTRNAFELNEIKLFLREGRKLSISKSFPTNSLPNGHSARGILLNCVVPVSYSVFDSIYFLFNFNKQYQFVKLLHL